MDLILVYGFTATVIGGLESPVGALVGGLISGLCISYVGGYLGSGLEPLGALVLLMVALMARPEGILARRRPGGCDRWLAGTSPERCTCHANPWCGTSSSRWSLQRCSTS